MTCPEVKAIYEETIRELTFRNSDAITIPKNVRENAYTLAIDIVIISTAREVYKNYGVSPAEGFYGNATLVMNDMCEIKIPVKMPRQRLYYGRVDEAFLFWQSLVDWTYFQAYFSALGKDLIPIGNALGISYAPAPFCCSLPDRSWIELPLREVYFNCPNGTQYKIEVSWYKALQITDGCGNIRDPRSKTTDGDKDTGLPTGGSQPNVAANPNNPFANLPLPTTDAEQLGFSNSKLPNLDNVDPSNIPNPSDPFANGASICSLNVAGDCSAFGQGGYSLNYSGIRVPKGDSFTVDSRPNDGTFTGGVILRNLPSSPIYGVKMSPSGLFYNAETNQLQNTFYSFSQCQLTLTGQCVVE